MWRRALFAAWVVAPLAIAQPDVKQANEALGTETEPPKGPTSEQQRPEVARDQQKEWPDRLGPAEVVFGDRGNRIGVGLATQLRVSVEHTEQLAGDPEETDVEVEFRRLRVLVGSEFLDGMIQSSFQVNIAPRAFELIDMWVSYRPLRRLGVRAGQFKIPYTRYRAQSFAALSLVDWSPVTRIFGAERQIGFELLDPAPKSSSWQYAAGVFAGPNARGAHAVGITEIYGESPVNRSDLRTGPGITRIHPELVGRVAKNLGAIDTSQNSDSRRGPLRQSFGLSAAWDARPEPREDLTARAAFEWLLKVRGVYFNGVAHAAWFDGAAGTDFGAWGWLAETGYRFDRTWEIAFRFSRSSFSKALRDDAKAYAEEQVGDGSEPGAVQQYALAGRVRHEDELALAGNSYLIGQSLKAQLSGVWSFDETELGRRNVVSAFLQLQFQF